MNSLHDYIYLNKSKLISPHTCLLTQLLIVCACRRHLLTSKLANWLLLKMPIEPGLKKTLQILKALFLHFLFYYSQSSQHPTRKYIMKTSCKIKAKMALQWILKPMAFLFSYSPITSYIRHYTTHFSHCNIIWMHIINTSSNIYYTLHSWIWHLDQSCWFFIESSYKDLSCPLKNSTLLTLSLTAILTLAVLSATWDPQITLLGLQVPLLLLLCCWEWVKLTFDSRRDRIGRHSALDYWYTHLSL